MKVLVVEDSPEMAETIRFCLNFYWPGSTIVITPSAGQAPGMVEREAPDLVLLDLRLPDGDGIEVLKRVREFSKVPLLIVSVRLDEASRRQGLENGADGYIVKPFSHTELMEHILKVLPGAGT